MLVVRLAAGVDRWHDGHGEEEHYGPNSTQRLLGAAALSFGFHFTGEYALIPDSLLLEEGCEYFNQRVPEARKIVPGIEFVPGDTPIPDNRYLEILKHKKLAIAESGQMMYHDLWGHFASLPALPPGAWRALFAHLKHELAFYQLCKKSPEFDKRLGDAPYPSHMPSHFDVATGRFVLHSQALLSDYSYYLELFADTLARTIQEGETPRRRILKYGKRFPNEVNQYLEQNGNDPTLSTGYPLIRNRRLFVAHVKARIEELGSVMPVKEMAQWGEDLHAWVTEFLKA